MLDLLPADDEALDNYVEAVMAGQEPPDPNFDVNGVIVEALGQQRREIEGNPMLEFLAFRQGFEQGEGLPASDPCENLEYLWDWDEMVAEARKAA